MKSMVAAILAVLVILSVAPRAAQADPVLDVVQQFIAELPPEGAGMMLVQCADATAAGPAVSWQLRDWPVYLDLGVVRSSHESVDVIPGASVDVGLKGAAKLRAGLARTPSSYGGIKFLGVELRNVGVYAMLAYTF